VVQPSLFLSTGKSHSQEEEAEISVHAFYDLSELLRFLVRSVLVLVLVTHFEVLKDAISLCSICCLVHTRVVPFLSIALLWSVAILS